MIFSPGEGRQLKLGERDNLSQGPIGNVALSAKLFSLGSEDFAFTCGIEVSLLVGKAVRKKS